MAKRKLDMKRYLPLGVPMDKVLSYFGLGLIAASLVSLQFVARYSKALDALYYWQNKKRVLRPGAVITPFFSLIPGIYWGFYVLMAAMAVVAVGFYFWHYHQSRSIYTMRRLPHAEELPRRCLAAPLAGVILSLLTMAILTALYYLIYRCATPAQCLNPQLW